MVLQTYNGIMVESRLQTAGQSTGENMGKPNENTRICTQCEDQVIGIYRGSLAVEVLLYILTIFSFCIPGMIYSWFRRRKGLKCPACNTYTLVPVESARAKKILQSSA